MDRKTRLPGKDAFLEETLGYAESLVHRLDFSLDETHWRHPTPHCWSVHLRHRDCPILGANGKGISRQAALASAYGEFFERLATNFFFADSCIDVFDTTPPFYFFPEEKRFTPTKDGRIPARPVNGSRLLNSSLRALYDPNRELTYGHLCEQNTGAGDRGICALPFKELGTGKEIHFPVAILNNLYASNGMAAGNTKTEALSQALSEIIERHVKNQIISKGLRLPDIPGQVLSNYPRSLRIIKQLEKRKFTVRVKDGSLGGRFPVICVLLIEPTSGGMYAAFGANLRIETAIERTLTELLQGRSIGSLHHFLEPSHNLEEVGDPFNLESHFINSEGLLAWTMLSNKADYPFTFWDFHGTTQEEYRTLQAMFDALGATIYQAEYHHLGMYACRLLVPGISEVYPIDHLIYNPQMAGASLRADLLRLKTMDASELATVYNKLEELGLADRQLLGEAIGVVFDADSAWSTLRIGELKALLLLAVGNYSEAFYWSSWCVDHGELPESRHRLFRLLKTLIGLKNTGQPAHDYAEILQTLYSDEELAVGEAAVAAINRFPGLPFAASWTGISTAHRNLLKIYAALVPFKNGEKQLPPPPYPSRL